MVDYSTLHCRFKQRSHLTFFVFNACQQYETETTHEKMDKSQAPLLQTELQTFPSDMFWLEIVCQTGEQCLQELVIAMGHTRIIR